MLLSLAPVTDILSAIGPLEGSVAVLSNHFNSCLRSVARRSM